MFFTGNNKLSYVVISLFMTIATSCGPGSSSQSTAAAVTLHVDIDRLYASISAATTPSGIASMRLMSPTKVFEDSLEHLDNRSYNINGHIFSGLRTAMMKKHAKALAFYAQFPTMGDYWDSAKYNPASFNKKQLENFTTNAHDQIYGAISLGLLGSCGSKGCQPQGSAPKSKPKSKSNLDWNEPGEIPSYYPISGGRMIPITQDQIAEYGSLAAAIAALEPIYEQERQVRQQQAQK